MDQQYVAFTPKEIEVLIKIMKLIIESDTDHDTVLIQMPPDKDGYAPKLEITILS